MNQEAELMDSLCKFEMLTNVQSQGYQEEKKLFHGIAEIIGKSDRQLRHQSRIQQFSNDAITRTQKDFQQKLERDCAQQLQHKINNYKQSLKNKDELKNLICSGISFKNPGSHKISRELKINPNNLWQLAQII